MDGSSGKRVRVGALELRFLVDETEGSGELVMFEFLIPPHARVPAPHFHQAVDEGIYGLTGVITTTVDGRAHEVGPGDAVLVPRGSVHQHENLHPLPARARIVLTPGSIGRRYFEEIAAEVNGPMTPHPDRIKAVMLKHGLVPV